MRPARSSGVLAAVVGVLVLCSCGAETATPIAASGAVTSRATEATSPDDSVEVVCRQDGIHLSQAAVATRPFGVVLTVSRTRAAATYLIFSSTGGPAGGRLLPRHATRWTLQAPPGELRLGCADPPVMDEFARGAVRVVDQDSNWRSASLEDTWDCQQVGLPAWNAGLVGAGRTPTTAVADTAARFSQRTPAAYSARPARVGYARAAEQTWSVAKNGRPHITVLVSRHGTTYRARPELACTSSD